MFTGQGAGQLIATSASDSNGMALPTERVEMTGVQFVLGSPVYAPKEVVAVALSRDYLQQHSATGLDIQLKGFNNGSAVVKLPADYVSGYLAKYEAAIAQNKK
jgi:hypothetical protein